MNDFYKGIILSILRKALTGVSAVLVTNGWLTQDQTTELTLGIAGLVASVALSLWDQYSTQLVKLSALQLPKGSTLDDAKALVKTESAPSVTTASDVAPTPAKAADIAKATGAGVIPPLLLALALLPGLVLTSACGKAGPNLRPVAIASETFAVALKGLQAQFVQWSDAGVIAKDVEVKWQGAFKQMAVVGLAVDDAIRAGDHAAIAAQADAALALVDTLIAQDVVKLNANQRGIVTVALQSVRGFMTIWQALRPPTSAHLGSRADLLMLAEAH